MIVEYDSCYIELEMLHYMMMMIMMMDNKESEICESAKSVK